MNGMKEMCHFIGLILILKKMQKICPVCGNAFECKNDDILKCECARVMLSSEARSYISKHYNDCLCVSCLRAINEKTVSPPIDTKFF